MLQVLQAREPSIRQEPIGAWLPASLRPPQVRVLRESPAAAIMMLRRLGPGSSQIPTAPVTYWQTDVF
jgi:hypothetical protein